MSYTLEFSKTALADIEKHKKSGDKALLKKIAKLLNELLEHPTTGTGQPEKLKHHLQGLYSRRINQKHRLVYSIKDEIVTVYVLSAHGHYYDK
ncbi:Txe/YoeB family addiction module toxin [Persicobacter diffluens]|uniref:Putative mRNA interferase YoeB n=1 Tax=Persicobacter diffluens TaxID=981 RepID=A0AAN4W404_9BACT|nr:Txe/YoeB family addiction module toxin [Persicobacter diffluens]